MTYLYSNHPPLRPEDLEDVPLEEDPPLLVPPKDLVGELVLGLVVELVLGLVTDLGLTFVLPLFMLLLPFRTDEFLNIDPLLPAL